MTANDPTGALTGEFHPGDINEGPLPQRTPGSTLGIDAVAEAEVQRSIHPKPSERYLLDETLLVEVTVVTATAVEYRTVNDADAIALGWGKTSGGYEALSGIDDFMSRAEAVEAPQDHGPLAAHLSDRTLAKVLSRPAHVPSLALLDRDEAAQNLAALASEALDALRIAGPWTTAGGGAAIDERLAEALADYRAAVQS